MLTNAVICSVMIVLLSQSGSTLRNEETPELDLRQVVQYFETCAVHIVRINLGKHRSKDSFHLIPFSFPVVQTEIVFQELQGMKYLAVCDNSEYFYADRNQKFKYNFVEEMSLCTMMLYLTPRWCKSSWTYDYFWHVTNMHPYFGSKPDTAFPSKRNLFAKLSNQPEYFLTVMEFEDENRNPTNVHNRIDSMRYRNTKKIILQLTTNQVTTTVKRIHLCRDPDSHLLQYVLSKCPIPADVRYRNLTHLNDMECVNDIVKHRFNRWAEVAKIDLLSLRGFFGNFDMSEQMWIYDSVSLGNTQMIYWHIYNEEMNVQYLNSWQVGLSLDVTLLKQIFPNVTFVASGRVGLDIPKTTIVFSVAAWLVQSEFMFETTGLRFVTCSRSREQQWISLKGFVSAFDWQSWLAILMSVLVVWIFYNFGQTTKLTMESISVNVLTAFNVLLEQGVSYTGKQRFCFGIWIGMCIILSNCYKGENINELIAPLPVKKYETFEQLKKHNFSLHTSTAKRFLKHRNETYLDFDNYNKTLIGAFWNILVVDSYMDHIEEFARYFDSYKVILEVIRLIKRPSSVDEIYEMGREEYFVDKLLNCEDDAFMDDYKVLHSVHLKLRDKLKKENNWERRRSKFKFISVGKEDLMSSSKQWNFHNLASHNDKFLQHIRVLWEGGLESLWRNWEERVTYWKSRVILEEEKANPNPEPISLSSGNVRVVFFLLVILLSFSFLVLLVEMRQEGVSQIKSGYMLVVGKCQKTKVVRFEHPTFGICHKQNFR